MTSFQFRIWYFAVFFSSIWSSDHADYLSLSPKTSASSNSYTKNENIWGQTTADAINALPLSMMFPMPHELTMQGRDSAILQLIFPFELKLHLPPPAKDLVLDKNSLILKIVLRYKQLLLQEFEKTEKLYGFRAAFQHESWMPYYPLNIIHIHINNLDENLSLLTDESYSIEVLENSDAGWELHLKAASISGLIYAFESFSQLGGYRVHQALLLRVIDRCPFVIQDAPRFPHRGLMLDTSRHFIQPASIKKLFDGMVTCKLNVFHWHVVDAQSFPVLFHSVPELAHLGAYSKNEVYRRQDILDIVQYGLERGIRVIPEFDMPGHTHSWGLSHPELVLCKKEKDWPQYSAAPPSG
jgi:Glycosyl hydrolase family 20, catalytic domain/beta-acetyl hexosaminidase like